MSNRIDGHPIRPIFSGVGEAPSTADPPSSERALRAMARDRLDAFAAGAEAAGAGDDVGCPDGDYDRCIDRTVPNAALWLEQSSDSDAIDKADVRQRQIGDCHVMVVLSGLATTADGRALLRSAIVENTNGAGEVVSYTVTLHKPQRHWFSDTTFATRQIDVPAVYARGHAAPRPAGDRNEVWALVMERAYAKYAGGYDAIAHGGKIEDAMEIITGRPARTFGLGLIFGRYGTGDLQRDLNSGHVVVVASRDDVEQTRPDLVPNHAYLVAGFDERAGKPVVRLWNPWGIVQPAPVPFDRLRSLFTQVVVGSAK